MSDHDVAHLHPLTNIPTKYQLPTPYSFRDIARTRFYRSRSLRQGQIQGQTMTLHHLHPLTNIPTKYQLPTPYGFRDIARTRFYRSRSLAARSKVKSRSHYDVAQTTPPNQCPYQVSTSYTLRFQRYSPDKIFKLKVTTARSKVKSRSDHERCTTTPPNQCPYQVSTSYTLWFLRYSPDKLFPAARPPIRTPWVKTIPQQPLRAVG